MSDENYFMSIIAGQEVVIDCIRSDDYLRATVTKITPKQIVTANGRFRRETGHEIGGDIWRPRSIAPPDYVPTLMLRANFRRAQVGLRGWDMTRKSVERMRKAADLAEAALRECGKWDAAA